MKLKKIKPEKRQKYQSFDLKNKIKLSKKIIKKVFDQFDWQKIALAWTGGKDSTLLLWLIKEVGRENDFKIPKIIFVDEGDVFQEIWRFVEKITKDWQLDFSIAHNKDVSSKAEKIGDIIKVADLNQRNQEEIKRLGFAKREFPFQPESFVGNHLMKTVATNIWLEKNKAEVLFTGVRWDEQPARAEDDFLRRMEDPLHFRAEPILHFSEKDVWQTTHQFKIPFVDLYQQGYRSLGAKTTTDKPADKPAWEQDLEKTKERAGRQQDKEKIMERLRALGYM